MDYEDVRMGSSTIASPKHTMNEPRISHIVPISPFDLQLVQRSARSVEQRS